MAHHGNIFVPKSNKYKMARVEIRHKCITIAREAAKRDSISRMTGRSIFIKRYYGKYKLICVEVSKKQRSCRDMFADAQRLASKDLLNWNRKRHWQREAKRHKISGAHRMAVSAFYKLLKESGLNAEEALFAMQRKSMRTINYKPRKKRLDSEQCQIRTIATKRDKYKTILEQIPIPCYRPAV